MNQLQIYQRIMILSIFAAMLAAPASLILPGFCSAQDFGKISEFGGNEEANQEVNQEVGEVKADTARNGFINTVKKFWEIRVIPCFHKIGDRITNFWYLTIKPGIQNAGDRAYNIWHQKVMPCAQGNIDKIKVFLGKEIEEQKPGIKEEFSKEKEEFKQEAPGLWYRLKGIIWGQQP
jgi:hypothetical protein